MHTTPQTTPLSTSARRGSLRRSVRSGSAHVRASFWSKSFRCTPASATLIAQHGAGALNTRKLAVRVHSIHIVFIARSHPSCPATAASSHRTPSSRTRWSSSGPPPGCVCKWTQQRCIVMETGKRT